MTDVFGALDLLGSTDELRLKAMELLARCRPEVFGGRPVPQANQDAGQAAR